MTSEVSALVSDLYTGRVTRRAFCKHALALGLSTSAAITLLESCDLPGSPSHPPVARKGTSAITWESETDTYETFPYLANKFSSLAPSIQVQQILGPSGPINPSKSTSAQPMLDDFIMKLQAGQGTPDILSLDVVWVSELASKTTQGKHWIVTLDDRWPVQQRANYLPVPLQAVVYNGNIWAAPLHTDVGILYYRKDLFPTPPQTWQELGAMAQQAMNSQKTRWGYVWQGALYEGMLCNFVEVLSSYGASIFDNVSNPKVVVVNSDAAIQALTQMVSWVGSISPPDIVRYQELEATDKWLSGEAAFMRNWPTAIALSNDATQSKVAGNFGIAPLPAGTQPTQSCLGGWQLAINGFSPNADAAWEFIQWMLQPDAQQYLAIKESFSVTLNTIYRDPNFPYLEQLAPILKSAQFRPISPRYQEIASAIETHIYQALLKQVSPATALQALQAQLEVIIG